MNYKNLGKIYYEDYEKTTLENPDLLEIFDFLNINIEDKEK